MLLCFLSYTLGGLICYFHSCYDYPYTSMGLILQGFFSYWSDVHTLGLPSIAHVCDPTLATFLFCLCFSIVIDIVRKNKLCTIHKYIAVAAFFLGFFCKMQGSRYLQKRNKSRYIIWHILWHISIPLPIVGILLTQESCI